MRSSHLSLFLLFSVILCLLLVSACGSDTQELQTGQESGVPPAVPAETAPAQAQQGEPAPEAQTPSAPAPEPPAQAEAPAEGPAVAEPAADAPVPAEGPDAPAPAAEGPASPEEPAAEAPAQVPVETPPQAPAGPVPAAQPAPPEEPLSTENDGFTLDELAAQVGEPESTSREALGLLEGGELRLSLFGQDAVASVDFSNAICRFIQINIKGVSLAAMEQAVGEQLGEGGTPEGEDSFVWWYSGKFIALYETGEGCMIDIGVE